MNEVRQYLKDYATPMNVFKVSAALGVSWLTYKTVVIFHRRWKYRHIPGPSSNGLIGFYIGTVGEVMEKFKKGEVFSDYFVDLHKKYGDVFKFQYLDDVFLCTSDKEAIKELLIVKDYPKYAYGVELSAFPFGERLIGVGLLSELNYDRWKARRAIFNHGFHRHVLLTFVEMFNSTVNSLLEKFRRLADGKTVVSLFNEINRATLDAIALIAFGMNVDAINQKDSTLNIYLEKILYLSNQLLINPFMQYNPANFKDIREFRRMVRFIRQIGREKIMERVNAFKNNDHVPNDILTAILSSYKDENMDLEAMIDDFVTFFIAGQETTANTLAFCFLELGKNPKLIEKARQEIDRVLGERDQVTFNDVAELKYCTALFKETLRLFPPIPNLLRVNSENMNIGSYVVPKNTKIFMSTYMNARDERYFPKPLEFRPERFLRTEDNNPDHIENYVYHPFSLGPRNCIGQNFAQIEGVILIAKFLQKFDYTLDPTQSYAIQQNLTLRPKDGTKCILKLRS